MAECHLGICSVFVVADMTVGAVLVAVAGIVAGVPQTLLQLTEDSVIVLIGQGS